MKFEVMQSLTQILTEEHSQCDQYFVDLEFHVAQAQWDKAQIELTQFIAAMEQHLAEEEKILFPLFEERTGKKMGPTQVMCMEHMQMRQLFQQMHASVEQQDQEQFLGESETLLMLMRQHNAKEEQILYPMLDHIFAGELDNLVAQMRALPTEN